MLNNKFKSTYLPIMYQIETKDCYNSINLKKMYLQLSLCFFIEFKYSVHNHPKF
jgi:hypothetical protein